MKISYDFHIHTALSPCADEEMTPNNIINMAKIKRLDAIAITDHNCTMNCKALMKCAQKAGIIAIPGMELETAEEIHIICLLPNIEAADLMQEYVMKYMPYFKNRIDIYGEQHIINEDDQVTGIVEQLLLLASSISIEHAVTYARELGGVVIPAHIDRKSYSIISNLGIIPNKLKFEYVELSRQCNILEYITDNKFMKDYKILISSDAHVLENIFEPINFIEVADKSIKGILKSLS